MERKASVWILGNQLLLQHPVLAEAEAEYGRENVTVGWSRLSLAI